MRFSVVINTYNRAPSLRTTLDALRHQVHDDFEVVVVNGPSTDATAALLEDRAGEVRVVDCPVRVLGVSRNLGIDAAAGDVVAFIDDDAVPEPRWLRDLARAYEEGGEVVGGAGGLTLDQTGTRAQYRWAVCSRVGETNFDRTPPLDRYNRPGADPFLYLQGTNCSFRREVLEAVDGFDEHFDYIYDESELASRVLDAGWELRALEDAVVHHKFLPSHLRAKVGGAVSVTDPFVPIKNRVYFALRVSAGRRSRADVMASITTYLEGVRGWARDTARRGLFTAEQLDFWLRRADEGVDAGFRLGAEGRAATRPIAPRRPEAFLPHPALRPEDGGRRLCVAFATLDFPPKPMGGIARFTHDLAVGFAAAGHEAHVVTRDDEHGYRLDFEDGVWVHRFPVHGRRVPGVDGHPLEGNLDHVAAVHGAVARAAERAPVDAVAGSLWIGEPLLCALDPRWVTTVACNTPIRKVAQLQPETAAAPVTPWQISIEDALLRSPAHLQPVSHENAAVCREIVPQAPMTVVWHGVQDRRADHPRTRGDDGAVEVLFVGRLEPRKGIDTLLEATRDLLRERPEVRVRVLGGDNPHANGREGAWPAWVAEHAPDVADRILFEGAVADERLLQALADCDVFCAPSRYESFGLVHVEAMMMGAPVIGCDAGGMRETIVDGETGLLIPPGDAAALREALGRLAADAALRERLGAAGRARFEAEFRNEVAVARNVELLRRLTEGREVPEDAHRVLQERTRALLVELCDLDPVAAEVAADHLLDPHRFPIDYEDGVRRLLELDDEAFVRGLYALLLDREPEADGLGAYVGMLAGGVPRLEIVREMALSDEARAAGVDRDFLARLPVLPPAEAEHRVRVAWLHDDATFAAALHRALLGPAAPADAIAADTARLASGITRATLLAELLARGAVRERLADPTALAELRPEGRAQLAARLAALARGDRAAFVDVAYRALLGRPADPGGAAGFAARLAGGEPAGAVVRAIAGSPEARRLGMTPEVAGALGVEVGSGRRRVPGAQRAARAAKRWRDRVTGAGALQRAVQQQAARIADLEAAVERAASSGPGGGLNGELDRLEERLDEIADRLRASAPNGSPEPLRSRR